MSSKELLATDELAEYLGVPVRTIYTWRARREGPRGIRVGRSLRFRRADVDRWLDQHADAERA